MGELAYDAISDMKCIRINVYLNVLVIPFRLIETGNLCVKTVILVAALVTVI